MSATSIGGHVTVTIGGAEITLNTADIDQTPKVFSLPEGETVDVSLADLNTYLSDQFHFPAISFPGITETNLSINKLYISTAGIFDIGVNFVFGTDSSGWTLFPGFALNEVGFEANFSTVPNFTLSPTSGAAGSILTLTGYDLAAATEVKFGDTAGTIVASSNTATSVQVTVPPALPAGNVNVTLTNADGPSAAVAFTVNAA